MRLNVLILCKEELGYSLGRLTFNAISRLYLPNSRKFASSCRIFVRVYKSRKYYSTREKNKF